MGKHRKLVPTGGERWSGRRATAATLEVFDTPLGKLGGLICWENYMPLARYAMYAWGTQIYLAPTWDRGQTWIATLRHIAKEGRVLRRRLLHRDAQGRHPRPLRVQGRSTREAGEWINVGDSAIVAPGRQVHRRARRG